MKITDNAYLNNAELKKMADKYKFYIFGAGYKGKQLLEQAGSHLQIIAFVDNNRSGDSFEGHPVIGMEELKKQIQTDCKIIISTVKYAEEMALQLEKSNFYPEKDYYVWDDWCHYHCDEDIRKFIRLNESIWGKKISPKKDKQIIIPYPSDHDVSSVILAYCSQYLAKKYDADIYCYPRMLEDCGHETMWKVYQSFHAEEIIKPILSAEQEKKAETITEEIWGNINKMEDWKDISIFGISFGTTLIRDYFRFYMPYMNPKDLRIKPWLEDRVKRIVFWYDYINQNDVKVLLMWDGVHMEGYLRDIAITKGIPVYAIHYNNIRKLTLDYAPGAPFSYYKKFWNELSREEQEYGIEWSKKRIQHRLCGSEDEIPYMRGKSPYAIKRKEAVLEKNDKLKILICPHSFEDDALLCGTQIFDNNMLEWLCHLGELAEKTPDYDWYMKPHPNSSERDLKIIEMIVEKYPKIKIIRQKVSPMQLKEEGVCVALTIAGTIGHEYPMIGIPVINAGINPHMSFDFDWNPKTKEEYDKLIYNLRDLKKEINVQEIYQFYCIHYMYYYWDYDLAATCFFKNPDLLIERDSLEKTGRNLGAWKYKVFMEEWSEERHEELKETVIKIFDWLDNWQPDIFYRKGEW